MDHIRELDYLAIPEGYCRRLGGLRWCSSGEAVEYVADEPAIGCTFAMAGEIALFLEGYGGNGPLICFGFVLHLLHILGLGARGAGLPDRAGGFETLAEALRETDRPIRNAGALCALLCRKVPRVSDPPGLSDLGRRLRWPASAAMLGTLSNRAAEVPPLDPVEFEARVLKALSRLTPDDIRHWLRHGRGPVGGVGEAVTWAAPRDFGAVLADLERRPRLAGAVPLVERLAGALALPPRRLAQTELPTGGYADITTRGQPEQILPAQLALEPAEFLRRFASHELLYFHREEPRDPAAEELVIVVDQGVRTWGDVRLVLAASALVLVRKAARRGVQVRITTTGASGRIIEYDGACIDDLGSLLEASDLSPNPGAALVRVLDEPATQSRDVLLLTHPRSLHEPEVSAAARRAEAGTRLFAIAVEGSGNVELLELRHGAPVAIGRCRVEVRAPVVSKTPRAAAAGTRASPWWGDIEPFAFPFRFGPQGSISEDRYDLDESGEWLIAAFDRPGAFHLWRVDGTAEEILPRPMLNGEVLSQDSAVLGVSGGFVVFCRGEHQSAAAHYDLSTRRCNAHVVDLRLNPWSWIYLRHLHSIVTHDREGRPFALDLGADKRDSARSIRATWARREAAAALAWTPAIVEENRALPESGRAVSIDPDAGTIVVQFSRDHRLTCTPQSDGQPLLKDGRIAQVRSGGDLIAALIRSRRESVLEWFSPHACQPIGSYSLPLNVTSFALSRDGQRFVYRVGDRQLEVRDLDAGPIPRFTSPRERRRPKLDVVLRPSFLTISTGRSTRRRTHLIHWEHDRLQMLHDGEGVLNSLIARLHQRESVTGVKATGLKPMEEATYGNRFIASCSAFGLTVLVDIFGQVAICDMNQCLIFMVIFSHDKVAAWMPDGTRIGPVSTIGGPPTPDAAERIGRALRRAQLQAQDRGEAITWGQRV